MKIRRLFYPAFRYLVKTCVVPFSRLSGYERKATGNCLVLAPANQMQTILQGIDFLKTLDLEMFSELTLNRRFIFWYQKEATALRCGDVFAITDNFLAWGKDGVAVCMVQFLLEPKQESDFDNPKFSGISRREIRKKLHVWLADKPFPSELIDQYKELAGE